MRFLADENLEYLIISFLREKNIDVLAVRDIMKGAADSEIIEFAFKNDLIIITSDKDFGELTFRLQKQTRGIILLRFPGTHSREKAELLLVAINKLGEDIANKFVVVEKNTVRIRPLF